MYNKSLTTHRNHDKQVADITTINTRGLNVDHLAKIGVEAIKSTLSLMSKKRAYAIMSYVDYRIRKYYTILSK